jgi:hypothetical protein
MKKISCLSQIILVCSLFFCFSGFLGLTAYYEMTEMDCLSSTFYYENQDSPSSFINGLTKLNSISADSGLWFSVLASKGFIVYTKVSSPLSGPTNDLLRC